MSLTETLAGLISPIMAVLDPFCGPVGLFRLFARGTLLACGYDGWGDEIGAGFLITLTLAVATLPVGLVLGFFIALAKQSEAATLRLAANIYTTIFRGLPELLTIFMIYFGLQIGIRQIATALGFETSFEINTFFAGMIALALVFSAYASEVLTSAFKAIPYGQYEASQALGLHTGKTMRFIILPQLIRIALPGLGNLWMILIKDTALISVIGLGDILRQTGIAARVTKEAFMFYGLACLMFLALAIVSSWGFSWLEARSRRSEDAR